MLYVIGGFDGFDYLKDVECYNPQTDTWTVIPSLNRARSAASVTVMKERLFVLGGFNGQFLDSVEVFDPKINAWNFVSNMSVPRVHFGVTVI
jgi:N-acetylneuraminic acid mutarotase